MQTPDLKKITADKIHGNFLVNKKVGLDVLRLDKIHPVISGNKWFKLKYHLDNFNAGNYKGIVTFGGAWSNHILATASACYLEKINCVGIIRGERPETPSATLVETIKYGMELRFISRDDYRPRKTDELLDSIKKEFPGYYIVPEGGAGPDGEKGAGEILQHTDRKNYTHIVCAVGSGTMFNGIQKTLLPDQQLLGIVVLKGWKEKTKANMGKWISDYHFGGYAKYNCVLLDFMNDLFSSTGIPTDIVYTGKLGYAIFDMIKNDHFPPASEILMIHSGGLQGNRSLQKGSLIF
ncbi:MAG TPA: pyridoxal-phosphate dependent enzyme [Chitinophagaceae bacterium]|nr:pyridoxal-phosphate dependent enzyme [Chitinophagaceae bacterium]